MKSLLSRKPLLLAALFVALALIPQVVSNRYYLHMINLAGIYTLITIGLNILAGYTGQVSMGQAGYFAIGAYAAAMGGCDAVAFTGGAGENSAALRRRIVDGLEFIGLELGPVNTNREVRPRPAQSRGSRETWRRASRIERRFADSPSSAGTTARLHCAAGTWPGRIPKGQDVSALEERPE